MIFKDHKSCRLRSHYTNVTRFVYALRLVSHLVTLHVAFGHITCRIWSHVDNFFLQPPTFSGA